jgi:TolB-like protein/tetratricopeptide (TPR) repeat protein
MDAPRSGELRGARSPATSTEQPMSWWERLRKHKVAQWTLAYGAGAYTLLHLVEMLSGAFDWPHIAVRIVTLLLLLGLPISAALAWFHGHKAQHRVSGSELAILTVLLAFAGGVLWYLGHPSREQDPTSAARQVPIPIAAPTNATQRPPEQSIAVLPFMDMSEMKDQEYFSDGMSEQILDLLARVPTLRVIARTSSFAFKGKNDDVATIARRLNVAYILEGSVRKSGERVRITAQLIRTADSSHLWSETYDRNLTDVFAIQDEVALAVVEQLKVALLGGELPGRSTTHSMEAYALYLQARYLMDQRGAESMERAYVHLNRALVLDPHYADAWALLSSLQRTRVDYGLIAREDGIPEAGAAAREALSLEPENVEGLLAMSDALGPQDWNWEEAGRLIRKAVELEPGNARVISAAASYAYYMGRIGEAITLFRKSLAIDPMRPAAHHGLAMALLVSGDAAEAAAALRTALQLNPRQVSGQYWLGRASLAAGRASEALEIMQREEAVLYRLTGLAVAYQALGRRAESDAALKELKASYGDAAAYQICEVYSYRGELDEAFAWLERAYQLHDAGLRYIKADIRQAGIRQDPRYRAFLKKMNLPEP